MRMRGWGAAIALLPRTIARPVSMAALVGAGASFSLAADLPAGFVQETVGSELNQPIALAFAPDGRLFVACKEGEIRVIANGALQPGVFAQLSVFTNGECGLLGLAVDPDFSSNGRLYAFATVSANEQQIIRITEAADGLVTTDVIKPFLPCTGAVHNGGGLKIGPDQKLYFSIGDTGTGANSQDLNTLAGKIGRINLDGAAPADNPFVTTTGQPRSVYALGLRNPFRFNFGGDGRLFVLDVGSSGSARREEVNIASAGANLGWPTVEGTSSNPAHAGFTQPIFTYVNEGSSPAGVVLYGATQFPAEYHGDLFVVDFVSNLFLRLQLNGDAVASAGEFFTGAGGPADLIVGPEGSLYYPELIEGAVRRVSYGSVPHPNYAPPSPNENGNDNAAGGADNANENADEFPNDGNANGPGAANENGENATPNDNTAGGGGDTGNANVSAAGDGAGAAGSGNDNSGPRPAFPFCGAAPLAILAIGIALSAGPRRTTKR